jgi:hypothetical protein
MVCRFELASLESSFAKAHAAAHLTSDAVGFAFTMAWAAAATARTKLAGGGFLSCGPYVALAAAVAIAAATHRRRRSAYLRWRVAILSALRLLAVAAGVLLNLQVAASNSGRLATISLAAVVLPFHFVQLTLLPLVWRLRARQHLVLNLLSLAAVATCNARLASAALAQPAAAGLASGGSAEMLLVVTWLVAQVCPPPPLCSMASTCWFHLCKQLPQMSRGPVPSDCECEDTGSICFRLPPCPSRSRVAGRMRVPGPDCRHRQ